MNDDSIEYLELSCRAYNALKTANIDTISQVNALSDKELFRYPNLGKKGIKEIRNAIFVYLNNSMEPNQDEWVGAA